MLYCDKMSLSKSKTVEYRVWSRMKERCLNKKHSGFKSYGGRGINICSEWINSFDNFIRDMGNRPPGLQLDRIDNNKEYSKENCKWSTPKQNCRNRRTNCIISVRGEKHTVTDAAEKFNVRRERIYDRIRHGVIGDRLIETRLPVRTGESHPLAKLSQGEVKEIRDRYFLGESRKDLREKFNMSKSQIQRIVTANSWKKE